MTDYISHKVKCRRDYGIERIVYLRLAEKNGKTVCVCDCCEDANNSDPCKACKAAAEKALSEYLP